MTHRNQSLYRNIINVMELELLRHDVLVDYAVIAFRALTVTNGFLREAIVRQTDTAQSSCAVCCINLDMSPARKSIAIVLKMCETLEMALSREGTNGACPLAFHTRLRISWDHPRVDVSNFPRAFYSSFSFTA